MATTKQQILDGLAKVASPDGLPLTSADVLSDVVVSDGKVFFSIAVDAAEVARWGSVRQRAEDAVRAITETGMRQFGLTYGPRVKRW